jgi:hypothetical protein
MSEKLKPGAKAPASGQYEVIGPRGGNTGKEITMTKGEVIPPVGPPGSTVRITDRTHNKSGRG